MSRTDNPFSWTRAGRVKGQPYEFSSTTSEEAVVEIRWGIVWGDCLKCRRFLSVVVIVIL